MTIALSEFRSRVAPLVPSCPDPLIDQAVLDSCIEFCERSLIVRLMLDEMTTTAGEFEIELDPPSDQQVCMLMRAWVDGTEIAPAAEDIVGAFGYTASVTGETNTGGRPIAFYETQAGFIGLHPVPDDAYAVTARVATRPTRSATAVEQVLFDNWVEPIAHGALSRLYAMPGSWFDAKLSAAYGSMFVAGINRAMVEASRGRNRADVRVTPVRI
jgi:hypothetical protein